eukprot:jgi/Hompol1/6757/HPOL_005072-RA
MDEARACLATALELSPNHQAAQAMLSLLLSVPPMDDLAPMPKRKPLKKSELLNLALSAGTKLGQQDSHNSAHVTTSTARDQPSLDHIVNTHNADRGPMSTEISIVSIETEKLPMLSVTQGGPTPAILAEKLESAEMFFKMFKKTYVSRFGSNNDADADADAVQQNTESYSDMDQILSNDVRKLMRQHPQNTEAEKSFHKELFSKLKVNYLEQDAKEKFLKRVLDTPPIYASEQSVKELEQHNTERQAHLKVHKSAVDQLKAQVSDLAEHISSAYERIHLKKSDLLVMDSGVTSMERQIEAIDHSENPSKVSLQSELAQKIRSELEETKQRLADVTARREVAKARISALQIKKTEAETQAQEAIRISKSKDPQIEELGRWYKDMIALLYKCNGISEISVIADSSIKIVYQIDGDITQSVILRITLDQHNDDSNHIVDAQVVDAKVPVEDILDFAASFSKLDSALSYTVRAIYSRLQIIYARNKEMQSLEHLNIMYDPDSCQAMVCFAKTGRTFVFQFEPSYPYSKWQGIKAISVMVEQSNKDESAHWQ